MTTKSWPHCRKCKRPVHPLERGVFYAGRCFYCDFNETWPRLEEFAGKLGPAIARKKLLALLHSQTDPARVPPEKKEAPARPKPDKGR